jgi:inosine/xanthosine triphosphatase
MSTIVVASRNPVKIQAALGGFRRMFPGQEFEVQTAVVPSEVNLQPYTSDETLQGAHNRAANAARLFPSADYWVGIEGGVEENPDGLAAFAWIVIQSPTLTGKGRTGSFYLPPEVANLVRQGKELGEADDIVFNRSNSKQENGAIGILTGDVIDRAQLYEMAVILALVPFKNPDLYREK